MLIKHYRFYYFVLYGDKKKLLLDETSYKPTEIEILTIVLSQPIC
jgi:hypothetical protein